MRRRRLTGAWGGCVRYNGTNPPVAALRLRFEAAVLEHWAQRGCRVSRALPAADGRIAIDVPLPEGPRPLMLFEHLDGEATGKSRADVEAFATGLAALHAAGESYRGPASAYVLDLDYLLTRPLERLLRAPTMSAELRPQFEALGRRLHERIHSFGPLAQVICHGDAHGENNFIVPTGDGGRTAVFFDFDETGPGLLAFELAVYPWSLYPRWADLAFSEERQQQWRCFIAAYRAARPVAQADLAAVAAFMAVRHIWLLGEYAGRIPSWGSQTMATDALRRQADLLRRWESIELPY